jgi:DIS3-like exonuclease 2
MERGTERGKGLQSARANADAAFIESVVDNIIAEHVSGESAARAAPPAGGGGGGGGGTPTRAPVLPRAADRRLAAAATTSTPASAAGTSHYAPHLPRAEVLASLRAGTLLVGSLRVNAKRRTEAYVTVPGIPVDVFVDGEKGRNRALDGDLVALRLEGFDEWELNRKAAAAATAAAAAGTSEGGPPSSSSPFPGAPPSSASPPGAGGAAVSTEDTRALTDASETSALVTRLWNPTVPAGSPSAPPSASGAEGGSVVGPAPLPATAPPDLLAATASEPYHLLVETTASIAQSEMRQPRAVVVAVLVRVEPRTCVGVLRPMDDAHPAGAPLNPRTSFIRLCPLDARVPYVLLHRRDLPADIAASFFADPSSYSSSLWSCAVRVDEWAETSRFPFGMLGPPLGAAGTVGAETAALLDDNNVEHGPFAPEVLACLRGFEDQCVTVPLPRERTTTTTTTTPSAAAAASASSSPEDAAPTTVRLWRIPAAELAARRDLRGERIFTCDPTDAKDLDDALHVRRLRPDELRRGPGAGAGNGADPSADIEEGQDTAVYEIGVHIADVSFFIRPETALDDLAARRCTSTYLVDRVVPMLPPLLCEELCSLNPGVDRLAFSVIWRMNGRGELVAGEGEGGRPWIGRTVIRSVAKLDYATAQRMVDGAISEEMVAEHKGAGAGVGAAPDGDRIPADLWDPARRPGRAAAAVAAAEAALAATASSSSSSPATPAFPSHSCAEVWRDVRTMHRIAMARRRARYASGALSLTKAKLVFRRDPATGRPTAVSTYPLKDSNRMVEEYMLLANFLTAQALVEGVGGRALLRRHPALEPARAAPVVSLAAALGFRFSARSAGDVHNSLLDVAERDPDAARALEYLVTKPMQPALYFAAGTQPRAGTGAGAAGEVGAGGWAHYALAIPYYTHFTSPIRRYADVLVHRLLAESIGHAGAGGPGGRFDARAGPSVAIASLAVQASACNERKAGAKKAQERSDRVFLTLFVNDEQLRLGGSGVPAECMVVDIGGMDGPGAGSGPAAGEGGAASSSTPVSAFTVLIRGWDVEKRVYLDRCGWTGELRRHKSGDVTLVVRKAGAGGATGAAGGRRGQTGGPTRGGGGGSGGGDAEATPREDGAEGGNGLRSPAGRTPHVRVARGPGDAKGAGRGGGGGGGGGGGNQAGTPPPQALFDLDALPGGELHIRILTVFSAQVIAITDRLPIDIDVQLLGVADSGERRGRR